MNDVPCPVCGSDNKVLYIRCENLRDPRISGVYDYVRCTVCDMVYLCPQPAWHELAVLYGGETRFSPALVDSDMGSVLQWESVFLSRGFWAFGHQLGLQVLRLATLWESLPSGEGKGRRLLEIGCGSGRDIIRYHHLGWDVYGVDLNPKAIDRLRQFIPGHFECGPIETLNYPEHFFDVVRMRQVIEHIQEPAAVLRKLAMILRPGGQLYISCPNVRSLAAFLFGRYWIGYWPPFHLNLFSPSTLKRLLINNGFDRISVLTVCPLGLWILSYRQLRSRSKHVRLDENTGLLPKLILLPLATVTSFLGGGGDLVAIASRPA